jgi:hypothetical protein
MIATLRQRMHQDLQFAGLAEGVQNVRAERETVWAARERTILPSAEFDSLAADPRSINEAPWNIEDVIRGCERTSHVGPCFIELARSLYPNDRRAAVKRRINGRLGSSLVQQTSCACEPRAGHLRPTPSIRLLWPGNSAQTTRLDDSSQPHSEWTRKGVREPRSNFP